MNEVINLLANRLKKMIVKEIHKIVDFSFSFNCASDTHPQGTTDTNCKICEDYLSENY